MLATTLGSRADLFRIDAVLATLDVLGRDFNDLRFRLAPFLSEQADAGCLRREVGRGVDIY